VDYTPLARKLQAIHFDGPLYIESAFEKERRERCRSSNPTARAASG